LPDSFPPFVGALWPYAGRFVANRLATDNCEVLFARYPAGSVIEEHTHDTDNWGVITRGALHLTIGGTERTFGVGQWYQVLAGTPHAARFEDDSAEIEFWFAAGTMPPWDDAA